jgi:hypothetical protein
MKRLAMCPSCDKLRTVRGDGTLASHKVSIPVSRTAVPSVGAGTVRRTCPGSNQPPQENAR